MAKKKKFKDENAQFKTKGVILFIFLLVVVIALLAWIGYFLLKDSF